MARVTVEDCLRRSPNRFLLIRAVAKRARQLREGARYLVDSPKNEQIGIALREVAAGKIILKEPDDQEEQEDASPPLGSEDV